MARKTPTSISRAGSDSAPESFEAIAREMLDTALALRAAKRPLDCEEIRNSVARVCADGRSRGLQAERLIIELKRSWYSIPESATHEKSEVISSLVSLCILEFYRANSDHQPER
jgi:hypothetical protein